MPRREIESRSDHRAADILHGGGGVAGAALRTVLFPAELLFRVTSGAYHAAFDRGIVPATPVAVPAISVGNLTVGGTGKTPFVRWLVSELKALDRRPAILHGGYAPDEPALHRRWHPDVPVHAERRRLRAAGVAIVAGADVLVLDDAFQHRRIERDLDIVLVAAEHWAARPRLLPRGPWRESPAALRRADVVVVTRRTLDADAAAGVAREAARWTGATIAQAWLRSARWTRVPSRSPEHPAAPSGPVLAVTGIADPAAFIENARAAGARIEESVLFRDHHAFSRSDADDLRGRARERNIVTTEKDAVKLTEVAPDLPLWVLEQELVLEHGREALLRAVRGAIGA